MSVVSSSGSGFYQNPGVQPDKSTPMPPWDESSPITTANAGIALVNGTPQILAAATPNDGSLHTCAYVINKNVTSLETGGQVQLSYTIAGVATTVTIDPGGRAVGNFVGNGRIMCDPNTTVAVRQSTALTAGASVIRVILIPDS